MSKSIEGTPESVRVFWIETARAAPFGSLAREIQIYRGTPDSVRVFQMEAANAALFGLAVFT